MAKIAILYCKRIQDHSCFACVKCFKALAEKSAEFSRYDKVELVAMADCGDCPGLLFPRVSLLKELAHNQGLDFDTVHLATCMKTAMDKGHCPLDFDEEKLMIESEFGVKVVLGTFSA